MGYKSKGKCPNRINRNKCHRRFRGARANGPVSPVDTAMHIFIESNKDKMDIRQMLFALNSIFNRNLKLYQLQQFSTKHNIKYSSKTNLIIEMPNEDNILDVADLLPESIKKQYDKIYPNE